MLQTAQTIRESLMEQLKQAMRDRNAEKLDALRYLLSLIKNVEIDAHRELTNDEIIQIIMKEVKRRREAIEQFQSAGRTDLVTEETNKLAVFTAFLPEMITRDALLQKISAIIESLPDKSIGMAMKAVMAELRGKADGKEISDAVKKVLTG